MSATGYFVYRLKAENLIESSPYLWLTSHNKLKRSNQYLLGYRVNELINNFGFDLDLR